MSMTSATGFQGIQRAEMPLTDLKSDRKDQFRERTSTDNSGSSALNVQKDSKTRFDFESLDEKQKKKLEEELKKMNDSLVSSGKILKFKFNEEVKSMYVEVIDSESQEVIASLPPEFLIDLSLKMKELIGMFFDERR